MSNGDDDDNNNDSEGTSHHNNPYFTSSRFNQLTRGHRLVELDGVDDREETFGQMVRHCWKELKSDYCTGLMTVIVARILLVAKQLGYSFLVIWYDIRSFAEMSLAQIVLSWIALVICTAIIPALLNATPDEQRTVKYGWNIAGKLVGCLIVIGSVFLMHSSS